MRRGYTNLEQNRTENKRARFQKRKKCKKHYRIGGGNGGGEVAMGRKVAEELGSAGSGRRSGRRHGEKPLDSRI